MYEDLENDSNLYQPRTDLRHTPLLTIMSRCMTLENYFLQIAVLSRSIITTRMHSSRMRTTRSLTCAGGSAFAVADLHSKILDARPPRGPNSFNFMQFLGTFGKIICWRPPWGVGAPSSGKS